MSMKQTGVALIAAAIATLSGLAAGSDVFAAEPVELQVHHSWGRQALVHKPLAEAFMMARPDIKIAFRVVTPDYKTGIETVIRQSTAGQAPDVTFIGYNLMPQAVGRGLAVDLTPHGGSEAQLQEAGLPEAILRLGKVDGTLYGLPWLTGTPVVYYNLDLVKQAGGDPSRLPATWDEAIALAGKIKALGPNVAGLYYGYDDDWIFQALIYAQGSEIMNAERTLLAWDGEVGLRALSTIRRFVTEGGMRPMRYEAAQQQFAGGALGIMILQGGALPGYEQQIGSRFELKVTPLPSFEGMKSLGAPVAGNAGVILTRDPARQKAAWDYLMFASGPEGQVFMTQNNAYPPVNTKALAPQYLGKLYEDKPNYRADLEQTQTGMPWFAYPGTNGAQIVDVISKGQEAVIQGSMTPDQALADTVAKVNALLHRE